MAGLNERQPAERQSGMPAATLSRRTPKISAEVCHESPVLPEVGQVPPPRLQGRAPSRQDLRDLQVEPALQGSPALSRRRKPHPEPTRLHPLRKPPPGGFLRRRS